MAKSTWGLQQGVVGLFAYFLGWVSGLVLILVERDDEFVRFHAWQSILTFGGVNVALVLFSFLPFIGGVLVSLLSLAALVLWIVLMVFAVQEKTFKLPVISDYAQKLV